MELVTPRLLLRPYTVEDWAAAHVYGADPIVSQYQAWGPNTEEQTREFIRHAIEENEQAERQAYHLAIVRRDNQELIGGCTLRITNVALREAMIGYTLGPRFWNQGYMTEAARALLELGFGTLKLHRIISWCTPENIGSWRVMEKIGMRREGHEREAIFFKEAWHDWLRYAILDHEWRPETSGEADP